MIRYLFYEAKLSVPWGLLLLSVFVSILRLTKAFSPEVPEIWVGWVVFLEFVYPVLFPLLMFTILEREKQWHTLEVLVGTPKKKGMIFLFRSLFVLLLLVLVAIAAVSPAEYLVIIAPGLALGSVTFLFGLFLGEEVGLGLSLAWWGSSFLSVLTGRLLSSFHAISWFVLLLSTSGLPRNELFVRKLAHLGVGLFLFAMAFTLADLKRSWFVR